jgi:chorismate synthase
VVRIAKEGDSTGGVVRIFAEGLPPGIGEPVFGKLNARLGLALLSIGGVKSIELGRGKEHARMRGSEANDPLVPAEDGARPATNRSGGVLGGISTGGPVEVTLAVKPTPTLRVEQDTVDLETGEPARISGLGRFDMNFAPRVAVVGEAMTLLVLADALLAAGAIPPIRLPGTAG